MGSPVAQIQQCSLWNCETGLRPYCSEEHSTFAVNGEASNTAVHIAGGLNDPVIVDISIKCLRAKMLSIACGIPVLPVAVLTTNPWQQGETFLNRQLNPQERTRNWVLFSDINSPEMTNIWVTYHTMRVAPNIKCRRWYLQHAAKSTEGCFRLTQFSLIGLPVALYWLLFTPTVRGVPGAFIPLPDKEDKPKPRRKRDPPELADKQKNKKPDNGGMVFGSAARYNKQNLQTSSPVHFHYVAPSFWGRGGESRLGGLSEFVDHLFCILSNEEMVLRENGVEATFVGHPVLEDASEFTLVRTCKPQESKLKGLSFDSTVVSVLPGSRLQEVERMLPTFSKAMKLLKHQFPKLVTLIHVASNTQVDRYIGESLHEWPFPAILVLSGSTQLKYDAFGASQAALCTSGTVAVELQLARLPSLVAYRAHFLTELLIRYKAKIPYVSLPNILLDSPVIPEALFQSCNPSNLASILERLLLDEEMREKQVVAAETLTRLLHPSIHRKAFIAVIWNLIDIDRAF